MPGSATYVPWQAANCQCCPSATVPEQDPADTPLPLYTVGVLTPLSSVPKLTTFCATGGGGCIAWRTAQPSKLIKASSRCRQPHCTSPIQCKISVPILQVCVCVCATHTSGGGACIPRPPEQLSKRPGSVTATCHCCHPCWNCQVTASPAECEARLQGHWLVHGGHHLKLEGLKLHVCGSSSSSSRRECSSSSKNISCRRQMQRVCVRCWLLASVNAAHSVHALLAIHQQWRCTCLPHMTLYYSMEHLLSQGNSYVFLHK
jgi:hypothetical protein